MKMKTYNCEITGTVPLLQNRFATEEHGENKKLTKKKIYVPTEEAEKLTYRDKKGKIIHPSEHIFGALIKAGTEFRYEGKKSYKEIIKRGIVVDPFELPLLNSKGKQYKTWDEIDARRVVIQRNAVVRWRPMYNEGWKLQFKISILDEDSVNGPILKDILEKAGTYGIGDYRPRFGRFQVTDFKEDEPISKKQARVTKA